VPGLSQFQANFARYSLMRSRRYLTSHVTPCVAMAMNRFSLMPPIRYSLSWAAHQISLTSWAALNSLNTTTKKGKYHEHQNTC
jgi:hypothetical protein